jgi:hypothetical protein
MKAIFMKTCLNRLKLLGVFTLLGYFVFSFVSCDMYGYGKVGGDFSGVPGNFPPMLRDAWNAWDANTGKKYEAYVFGPASDFPYTWFDHYHLKDGYDVRATDYYFFREDFRPGGWPRRKVAIVRHVTNFSGNAGVIILEWLDSREPNTGYYIDRPFEALYFRIINQDAVQFGEAKNSVTNVKSKKATLREALASFTMGNEGDYVSWAYVPVYQRDVP